MVSKIKFNKNIGIFIVCRQSSKRFPDKIKKKIFDLSLLEIIILRLLKYFPKKNIIICTSNKNKNSFFLNIKKKYDINIFFGDDKNLFNRYIKCMKKYRFKHFIRLTGDNPFMDIMAIKKVSTNHIKYKNDYTYTSGLIRGTKPEIFSLKSLIKCSNLAVDPYSSEYLTFFYLRQLFKIQRINFKKLFLKQDKISISIDEPKHLINLKKIIIKKKDIYINRYNLLKRLKKHASKFQVKKKRYINVINDSFNVSLINDHKNFNKIDLKEFGII